MRGHAHQACCPPLLPAILHHAWVNPACPTKPCRPPAPYHRGLPLQLAGAHIAQAAEGAAHVDAYLEFEAAEHAAQVCTRARGWVGGFGEGRTGAVGGVWQEMLRRGSKQGRLPTSVPAVPAHRRWPPATAPC